MRLLPKIVTLFTLFMIAGTCFAGEEPCLKVGLIGEFERATSRTALPFGSEIRRGATIAVREMVGKKSKICTKLEIVDIKNTLANIPDAINKAYKEKHIRIFLGMGTSDQALVAQRSLKDLDALLFTPTASSDDLNGENKKTVMLFPTNSMIAGELAKEAIRKGIKSLAIVYGENSKYSVDISQAFEATYRKLGGRVTIKIPLRLGKISKKELQKLASMAPQYVLLPLYELDAARVIAYLYQSRIPVKYVGTDSWGTYSEVLKRFTGNVPIHAFFPVIYSPQAPNTINKQFVSKYHKNTGKFPTDLAAFSYDGIKLINRLLSVCSLNRAVRDTSNCLRRALPMDTITGSVRSVYHSSIQRAIQVRNFKHAS